MSNPSLKDQLRALSLEPTVTTTKPSSKPPLKKQKPAWLEHAQYGVELLKAHFPDCFKDVKELQPLKIGIKQDLVKSLSTRDDIVVSDKACMVNSLAYYVNSPAYHKNAVAGATRIDLLGNAAGVVTAEEAKYSIDCRKAKAQKNKTQPVT